MENYLHCNDPLRKGCSWSGDSTERVTPEDKENDYTHCPQCGGTDFEEEEAEEE